jgi:hypothetical protein
MFSGRSRVDELKSPGKPFGISKRAVWEAWEKVRANKGAPGVDGESIAGFEKDLKGNLYKIWNRMSSGDVLPAAGVCGGNREGARDRYPDARGADRR